VFVLKIALKLRETNALNLEQFFYKKIKSVIKIKEIRTLKLLIATNLNVYRLFLKKSLITIIIAHKRFEMIKLLMKKYNITLELYFIYIII